MKNIRLILIEKLRRVTNSTSFIAEIDGLRFLAISWVAIFHLHGFVAATNPAFTDTSLPLGASIFLLYGYHGVELFFVISGFILALPFAKNILLGEKKPKLKAYFLRRLTRLEPPYILNILACFAALAILSEHTLGQLGKSALASLFYLHNILPIFPAVNTVTWSLEIEVQFYILTPLFVLVFYLPKNIRRIILVLTIFLLPVAQSIWDPFSFRTLYEYLQYFLVGFLLADLYLEGLTFSVSRTTSIICGLGFLGIIFLTEALSLPEQWVFLGAILGLYFLVLRNDIWKKIFSWWPLAIIGGMCYSIYLWHYVIIWLVGSKTIGLFIPASPTLTLLLQAFLVVPAIMLISVFMYVCIERPCMDSTWPKRFLNYFKKQKSNT